MTIKKEILKDPILFKLSNLSKEKDTPVFLVGGYIRDLLIGELRGTCQKARKDYDFTLPKGTFSFIAWMEKAFHIRFFKVGREEMDTITYRIIKENLSIDLTFLQGEGIDEDLQRRDFTINAIAFSLRDETFHWVKGALEDIEKGIIRSVSHRSIDQDPLRLLRAVRYLCTLDRFVIDTALKNEISRKKTLALKLPGERIKMELDRILLSPKPALGMESLYEAGLFLTLLPEFKGLENLGQNEHHHLDVLSHTLFMIEKISFAFEWVTSREKEIPLTQDDWLSVYYAALFHDIGKQDTYLRNEKGRVHFYHHEIFSCQRAERVMERLRFSNVMRNRILHLIRNHMRILNLSREAKESALKRLVNQMGDEIPHLVLLTLADKEASRGILSIQIDDAVEDHCLCILELFHEKGIVHPVPFINGHDVIALGYLPGPKVGQILTFIREKQVIGEIKTREEAMQLLRERFAFGRNDFE